MSKEQQRIHSFKRGFNKIPKESQRTARREIMQGIGITSNTQWYARLNGKVIPNVMEKDVIETTLRNYKVKLADIWG